MRYCIKTQFECKKMTDMGFKIKVQEIPAVFAPIGLKIRWIADHRFKFVL